MLFEPAGTATLSWARRGSALASCLSLCAIVSCSSPNGPTAAALDQAFQLTAGGSATISSENLQVGFDQVPSDSRCPRGTQCIVAGNATARVWLSKPPRGREQRDLGTSTGTNAVYDSYRITLTTLSPYPEAGATIRPSDYVATLVVTRSP